MQAILAAESMGRLTYGDRASAPVRRYQRGRPELVHVDVKKLVAIPEDGGGAFLDTVGIAPKGDVDYWVTRDATHDERPVAGDDPAMRERTPGSGPGQVPVARR